MGIGIAPKPARGRSLLEPAQIVENYGAVQEGFGVAIVDFQRCISRSRLWNWDDPDLLGFTSTQL